MYEFKISRLVDNLPTSTYVYLHYVHILFAGVNQFNS